MERANHFAAKRDCWVNCPVAKYRLPVVRSEFLAFHKTNLAGLNEGLTAEQLGAHLRNAVLSPEV